MAECVAQSLSQRDPFIHSSPTARRNRAEGTGWINVAHNQAGFVAAAGAVEFKARGSPALKLCDRPMLAAPEPFISGWGAAI